MGTIVARKRADGSTAYMAKIILKSKGEIVHRETKTFERKPAAAAWIAKREDELSRPGEIERAKTTTHTLADAIDKYTGASLKKIGKTKTQVLRSLKSYTIADMACEKIRSQDIVELATELSKGRQPQTVANYISHLAAIFTVAKPAWGYALDPQQMKDAQIVLARLGLIKKSTQRDRRPTLDELDTLMRRFADRQTRRPHSAPMCKLIAFAIFSTRRQEEITRIEWRDLDENHSRVLVRDMKNPGDKEGNDVWCDLPEQAMRIIRTMPRPKHPKPGDMIFPYTAEAISAAFTRACLALGINTEDMDDDDRLRFHDLRHEGVSRLFELGWNIPHVAAVSGHRSWSSLKRYTHIREIGDKYEGWKWLDVIAPQPAAAAE
ncbi:tyrosine-type recombinase/integrase [Sinorhizobium meliloti]|nr:tyrosine-type recombinase/integrase [Sinorhizobium meliloti]